MYIPPPLKKIGEKPSAHYFDYNRNSVKRPVHKVQGLFSVKYCKWNPLLTGPVHFLVVLMRVFLLSLPPLNGHPGFYLLFTYYLLLWFNLPFFVLAARPKRVTPSIKSKLVEDGRNRSWPVASYSKTSLAAHPFIWKWDFIHMQVKIVFITMAVHQASFWHRASK